jgi:large subunit ribosomal protein L9
MEVILKENIKGLGFKNDVVAVKPGYGRNYLIPQGYALLATSSNKKMLAENIKQVSHKAEKIRKDAEAIANAIGELVLSIPAKVGESGKIFGAVTTLQIADALKAKGHDVDRRKIAFEGEVKVLGEYTAVLSLHKEVIHKVKFNVIPA